MTGLRDLFTDGILQRQKEGEMAQRELKTENGEIKIDRDPEEGEPEWMRCTESQWEKKAELALKNGQLGESVRFADYANCKALYEDGHTVKEIQNRFNHE